jgi:Putative conjugal transfer nickase/helicase TraI C-term/Putative helicase
MANIFLTNKRKLKGQSKSYAEATLFPILSAEQLLSEFDKKQYIKKVQELAALSDEYFETIYTGLINNFIKFVQILPEKYGEDLGGLLNDGLRRGLLAIKILHETAETEPHPLLIFAIYSVALLADVAQVSGTQRVVISDDKGEFIGEWCPFLGPMIQFGDYFKLRPYSAMSHTSIRAMTPILARQLLTETGITWLASNNQIFDMWLAFLQSGEDWAGGLGKILKLEKKQFESLKDQEIGLIPVEIQTLEPLDTELGEKFLAWLKKGLEDGSISVNQQDSSVHIVGVVVAGVFLDTHIFKQFSQSNPRFGDWISVYRQFVALGLTHLTKFDSKLQQFIAESPEAKGAKRGFLAPDKAETRGYGQKGVLGIQAATTQSITKMKNTREGVVIKDAGLIYKDSSKIPTHSQYLRDLETRQRVDVTLPIPTGSETVSPQRSKRD